MAIGVPSHPSSCSNAAAPAGSPATGCPNDCTKKTFTPREVSQTVSETISNAPEGLTAWNGTYSWSSKFRVEPSRSPCGVKIIVKIKIRGRISSAKKTAWKSAIEGRWSGKIKLQCPDPACAAACPGGYPVTVKVQWVSSGQHYVVTANRPAATEGGRAGIGGTTSMTGWGVNDTTDITHEFGHMLGCPEEYFTTDGTDYTHGGTVRGFRDDAGGIMNNPSNAPTLANYKSVRKEAATALGLTCTTATA